MARSELTPTSFDHREFKESLIEFLKSKDTFADFDYEGSAINTIIDVLTRNTVYDAFLANMLANESFLESAQIRGNVVAHAQKLSYVPRSRLATRAVCDITITPTRTPTTDFTLIEDPGLIFLNSVGGETYVFTTNEQYSFSYNPIDGKFHGKDVELFQGQFIRRRFQYNGEPIVIPNDSVDISSLKVFVEDEIILSYHAADSIAEMGGESTVYFIRENIYGEYEVSFGKDVLGKEPSVGSTIVLEYINTQNEHANGAKNFIAGSTIGGYSNITIEVKQSGYGGMDKEDIESIRFSAPKAYMSQNRALSPSDYEYITKREFPFLRSVISWGGEDHDPPQFGTQFISIVADDGIEITSTLKSRIEAALRLKGVGSVTPRVIDPNVFNIDMSVEYIVRDKVTTASRAALESRIKTAIYEYADHNLAKFNRYYNEADIIELLKKIKELESVVVNEVFSFTLRSNRYMNARYVTNFDNKIKPGTVKVLGFQIVEDASSETIEDDGRGNLVHTNVRAGVSKSTTIGAVDYETGKVEFQARFTHADDLIRVQCEVEGQNFYIRRNNVVRILSVDAKEVSKVGRF